MENFKYKIRAHHGMCINFFEGKGYNSGFTAHMADVIQGLQRNPLICLSMQKDEICTKCPNNINGICNTEEKVFEYDRKVISMRGLSEGMILPYDDFRKAVYENILVLNRREEICENCQWNSICHFKE